MKYDFFIAGRFRNKEKIKPVLDVVRNSGKSAYCFIENEYKGEVVEFGSADDPSVFMSKFEELPQDHPLVRKIFEMDINAEKESENFLLVLPAGIASHIEAGAAYGMGKKCYAIGEIEKTETLYNIFDRIFRDTQELAEWLDNQ